MHYSKMSKHARALLSLMLISVLASEAQANPLEFLRACFRRAARQSIPISIQPRSYEEVLKERAWGGTARDFLSTLHYFDFLPNELPYAEKIRLWKEMVAGVHAKNAYHGCNSFELHGQYKGTAFIGTIAEGGIRTFLFFLEDGRVIASSGSHKILATKNQLLMSLPVSPSNNIADLSNAGDISLREQLTQQIDEHLNQQLAISTPTAVPKQKRSYDEVKRNFSHNVGADISAVFRYLKSNPNDLSYADKLRLWQENLESLSKTYRVTMNAFKLQGKYSGTAFIGDGNATNGLIAPVVVILEDGRTLALPNYQSLRDLRLELNPRGLSHLRATENPEAAEQLKLGLEEIIDRTLSSETPE